MEITISAVVKHGGKGIEEVEELLSAFQEMVNHAIRRGLEKGYSLKRLHAECYQFFKSKYDFHTHVFPQVYRVAQSIIKSWKTTGGKEPVMRKRIVRLPKTIFRIDTEKGVLILTIRPRERIKIPLELSEYHRKLLAKGEVKEVLLGEEFVYIPIGIDIDLTEPKGFVAVDVNEDNITYATSDGKAGKIYLGVKRVKEAYHEKRSRIQEKVRGKERKELLEKYGKREQNKTKDILHKATKFLTDELKGYGFILENLKDLRQSTNKKVKRYNRRGGRVQEVSVRSKRMKWRLNSMPFHRIQNYIEYKAYLNGSPVDYVPACNTSRICARCGGEITNYLRACPVCGLDRDINACLNLLNVGSGGAPERLSVEVMKVGYRGVENLNSYEVNLLERREQSESG
ncbi:MAG: RNA-guided endonuclease InsQ/TnpB family protein [Candidatus Methanospirareceae archaeon]